MCVGTLMICLVLWLIRATKVFLVGILQHSCLDFQLTYHLMQEQGDLLC